jgi:hypothetical protein
MHRTLQNFLWLTPAILNLAIAIRMFRRKLQRAYPVFWSYLLFESLRTGVLFSLGNDRTHYAQYFYAYWITEIFDCVLCFFVVGEIFRNAFAKKFGLQREGTALFRLSLLALIAAAIFVAARSPAADANRLVAAILALKNAESFVLLGMVGALFFFVFVGGLPWSSYTIGIAIGLGIRGTAEVVALAARNHYGRMANRPLIWSMLVAGLVQVLVWTAYLLGKVADSEQLPGNLSSVTAELERLNEQVGIALER